MGLIALASRSPRRRELLDERGLAHIVVDPRVEDADLAPGAVAAADWAMALAHLKARAGREALRRTPAAIADPRGPVRVVLGADTICVLDGAHFGKPATREHAAEMLARFAGRTHEVITGVALLDPDQPRRRVLFSTIVPVRVGELARAQIEPYLDSGSWRGKAGGYNIRERLDAGWPIQPHGDAAAVMGLPINDIVPKLRAFGLAVERAA